MDKGNATVVMDRIEYERKALDVISKKPFELVKNDPTKKIEATLNKHLWKLCQSRFISKSLYDRLHASSTSLQRFYGRVKIHKETAPLRPVISVVGTAMFATSKYLASILACVVGKTEYTVRNSKDFIESLNEMVVQEDEVMISFDVAALYTNIPIDRALLAVMDKLESDDSWCEKTTLSIMQIVKLLELCLRSTYFTFREKYYRLTDGVAMGSPVSSIVANLFMERFEEGALGDATAFQPRAWKRYVDDVFSIVLRRVVDDLLVHLNGVDENIRFTMEQEEDRCLPFLDVSVRREDEGSLRTGVFRKKTHTDRTLAFSSHHAQSAKRAVVRVLLDRVDTHFSEHDMEGQAVETAYAKQILAKNRYPERFVQKVIRQKSSTSGRVKELEIVWVTAPYARGVSEAMARVLRPLGISLAHSSASWKWYLCKGFKDKIPISRKAGVVYEVACGDCDSSYIGESGRCLEVRIGEHINGMRRKVKLEGRQ